MKVHTNNFKDTIKTLGREIDAIITYEQDSETIELGNEEINSVSLHYEGAILKSVMKQLDIDSNAEIPVGTELNYQFGIKTSNEVVQDYRDNYEYLDYGYFIVYKVEKQEDMNSYKITCYDKMLYSMKDYEDMNITYPITIRDYIGEICDHVGLIFANSSDTFANYNRQIPNELYLTTDGESLNYTFRDVLDELAEVTASTICINANDELEIRYINNTGDTIDEEYLKDVNVNFGEVFGPVNTIVLSRSAGADNVYYPATLPENPKELKISDNQIMNGNDRDTYLASIYNKLNGLTYYLNDFSSTGICYYDLCDRYNVSIGENTYSCVMLNDEINVNQGLQENVYTELPEETVTDYTKADSTDRRINQTYLIVDKQNQTIESVVSSVDEQNSKISQITQTVDEINSKISDIADITTSNETTIASMKMNDINASEPIQLKVYPIGQSISYLYPRSNLYPSSTLYSTIRTIRFHNNTTSENFDYILPDDLLYYDSNNYDEFLLDYGDETALTQICKITKKCKYNADGTVGLLTTPEIHDYTQSPYTYPSINLTDGDYTISLPGYSQGYIFVRLMVQNIYTTQFYTKAETNSIISQTANSITSQVNAKVGNDEIIAKLNLAINNGQGVINILGNQVTIDSDNFTLDADGKITATAGDIAGFSIESSNGFAKEIYAPYDYTESDYTRLLGILQGTITPTQQDYTKYDFNDDGQFSSVDLIDLRWYLISGITTTNPGKFVITAPPSSKKLFDAKMGYFDGNNNFINGFGHSGGIFNAIDIRDVSTSNVINITPNYLTIGNGLNNMINMQASNGNITCVSLTQTSKEEFKKNFKKLENALDIIKNTDIYKYNLIEENDEDKKHIGFVIGDNFKYRKELTSANNDGVDIYSLASVCLQSIKEQQEIIENLQKRIEKLERESDK